MNEFKVRIINNTNLDRVKYLIEQNAELLERVKLNISEIEYLGVAPTIEVKESADTAISAEAMSKC